MFMLGLLSVLLSSLAPAEEIQVGKVYQGGQMLDISGLGVSFTNSKQLARWIRQ